MYNYKSQKSFKIVAIILLIAAFSFGVISCKNNPTEPSNLSSSLVEPGETGPGDTNDTGIPEPEPDNPEQPTFPSETYIYVYTPFVSQYRTEGYGTNVSYQDTNTLLQLWKEMMGRKDLNAGNSKRWFIREAGNDEEGNNVKNKNYYFFDKNFDLVYYRQDKGALRVRKLVGAVIVKYSSGKNKGTYTIAGLYENLVPDAGRFGWENFSKFMHAGYDPHIDGRRREVGDLELLLLNVGLGDDINIAKEEYGVQSYYNDRQSGFGGYRNNKEYFLGKSPADIDNDIGGDGGSLNYKIDLTYSQYQFRFVTLDTDSWELLDHSMYSGWHPKNNSGGY